VVERDGKTGVEKEELVSEADMGFIYQGGAGLCVIRCGWWRCWRGGGRWSRDRDGGGVGVGHVTQ
jgi:hypothetical protein